MIVSSEKSRSDQSEDPSEVIIHIWGFGGKCTNFLRETSETAPLSAQHLDSLESLWAGLILHSLHGSNQLKGSIKCGLVQLVEQKSCNGTNSDLKKCKYQLKKGHFFIDI